MTAPVVSPVFTADRSQVCLPWQADLAALVPHARTFTHGGAKLMVMPNGHDEARVARNVGVHVPSPILTRYDWCRHTPPPYDIQRTTAAMLTEHPRAYVLSTMGTGKTRAALYAADWLIKGKRARRVLVSAPLSTLTPVWESEMFGYFPHLRVRVLHGSRARRLKLLAEDADVYVINHHGVGMIARELVARGIDIVVVDELAILRNKGTDLWKAHHAVVEPAAWAWGMTGSPTPNAPTDAWAQVRLLTPERTARTMASFQDQTMLRVSQFRWVPRPDANDTVFQAMQPAVRFTRDDIAELPPTSFTDRSVALDREADAAYRMLFSKMRTMTLDGRSITAVNEGVLQSKLLQVACGFIYTDTVQTGQGPASKTVYALPNTQRLAALDETLAETDRKAIVFVPFVHALEGVAAHLRAKGHDVGLIHGGVSRAQRDLIFRGFQHGASPRFIVAHPGCMSHGLTLTAANTIVWYAPTQSLETYEQANARIVRPPQTSKTLIAHLFGTAVERATYARLKKRGTMQGLLLEMFRKQELEF